MAKDFKTSKLSKLKKGDYFRFAGKKKVFTYDGKTRIYDKWGKYKGFGYGMIPNDDVWGGWKSQLKDAAVEIDFTY
jgi:hypothetical protein